MIKPLIAGNWKMNGTRASIRALLDAIGQRVPREGVEVAVCAPHIYLEQAQRELSDSPIHVGAQDANEKDSGAYTGETSAAMLADLGCRYVIIGHSERRALFGDTDARVAAKFTAVQRHGMTPILCVGETLDEREQGITQAVVSRQLDAVMDSAGVAALANAVIAYEPVWAIGTGKTATPEQAQDVHAAIRARVAARDASVASGLRILYGGSMNAANAKSLLAMPDINGGLIGGASLKAEDFLAICQAAV